MPKRVSLLYIFVTYFFFFALLFGASCTGSQEGCANDEDCKAEATLKVCDLNNKKCVQCFKDDHCSNGESCNTSTNLCEFKCKNDSDCDGKFGTRKNVKCSSGKCQLHCDTHDDCESDELCKETQCVKGTRPVENLPGRFAECPERKCQGSLKCLSYAGGSAKYCLKKCSGSSDCKDGETCVPEKDFADGHAVCLKSVTASGAYFNYDQGTACAEGMGALRSRTGAGAYYFGSCWKPCNQDNRCASGYECIKQPNFDDPNGTVCMKACTDKSVCEEGADCLPYDENNPNSKKYCQ